MMTRKIFLVEFENLISEMKVAGATMSEKEEINYLLRTLTSLLSSTGDIFHVLEEQDQTEAVEDDRQIRAVEEVESSSMRNKETSTAEVGAEALAVGSTGSGNIERIGGKEHISAVAKAAENVTSQVVHFAQR